MPDLSACVSRRFVALSHNSRSTLPQDVRRVLHASVSTRQDGARELAASPHARSRPARKSGPLISPSGPARPYHFRPPTDPPSAPAQPRSVPSAPLPARTCLEGRGDARTPPATSRVDPGSRIARARTCAQRACRHPSSPAATGGARRYEVVPKNTRRGMMWRSFVTPR